jgi:DNA-binding SARP family transcriptional activator
MVEFRILGPLEAAVDSKLLELHGNRQQTVLAMLLLGANNVVPTDRLLEAIYGECLPPTARSQAQIIISSLRRMLASCGDDTIIRTHPHGYVIRVDEGQLDSQRFEGLVSAAKTARSSGNPQVAVARYRDAARLSRGPALYGIESEPVRAAAARLDEMLFNVIEERIALELELGRHQELVGELTELVARYPYREQLRRYQMLALYRCDRTAEALESYRQARRMMIDELGVEPSDRLQQLECAILNSDPVLDLRPDLTIGVAQPMPARREVPNLLPADIADFTGRTEQIARICRHLRQGGRDRRLASPVVVVEGRGGVGKTTLAVHVARRMADEFPDGQLFADLHADGSQQVSPARVLERFLRALGLPGPQIPEELDERAEMFRNLLAKRKILVVLDNVASESQVSPLLPGGPAVSVIVTSRTRFTGLAGALRVELDVFDVTSSVDLLTHIVGSARLRAYPEVTAAIARHCDNLPLALRIAGARLAARPHWSARHMVERLADESRRLDELRHGEMGIRASISLTYESASKQAQQLFRLLALLEMPAFSGWVGAAVLDETVEYAEDLLDELVSVRLIDCPDSGTGPERQYRFHDLIRVFARERLAAEESAAQRRIVLERVLGGLLYIADEARRRYYGGDFVRIRSDAARWPVPDPVVDALVEDPLIWYDQHRTALVSGVRQAANAGFAELCWSLASTTAALFEARVYLDEWRETHEIALQATRNAGNVRGQAAMLYHLGALDVTQLRFESAREKFVTAARLFEGVRDPNGIALVTRHLATIDRLSGRFEDARLHYEQALEIFQRIGDLIGVALAKHGLAQIAIAQGRSDTAMTVLSEALALCETAHCRRIEAQVLHRIGEAHVQAGQLDKAVNAFERSLAISADIGDLIGIAYAQQGIGTAQTRRGEFDHARAALQDAVELARRVGERLVEGRALLGLSELALAQGEPGPTELLGERATAIFEDLLAPLHQARSLPGCARADPGEIDSADETRALEAPAPAQGVQLPISRS